MTRKHFVDIAEALSESRPHMDDFAHVNARGVFDMRLLDWNRICLEMGKALQRHNNRFEMQRFLFACGMDRENESQEVK